MCTAHSHGGLLPKTGSKPCSQQLRIKEKKTRLVVLISAATMVLEIVAGYITNSMALLSDGWHMCSHVVAIGAGWLTYKYLLWKQARTGSDENSEHILSLTGFINALMLFTIAVFMVAESIERLYSPVVISYGEALYVATIGLLVNLISVKILHLDNSTADNNLKGAYLHVLSDVLTSVLALVALGIGLFCNLPALDALMGIVGSIVIIVWAWGLAKSSARDLIRIRIENTSSKN